MIIEEAHRIAAARLGPALHHVTRGGPAADEWLVQAVPPSGPLLSARAAGLDCQPAGVRSGGNRRPHRHPGRLPAGPQRA